MLNDTYEVYIITNTVNGKRYIGKTRSSFGYQKRWKSHCEEARRYPHVENEGLHSAINAYGPDSFEVHRLIHSVKAKDIDRAEQFCIRLFKTHYINGNGYNLTYGGKGVSGYHHTEKTKKLLHDKIAGKPLNLTQAQKDAIELTKRQSFFYERRRNSNWRYNLSVAAKNRFKNEPGTFTGRTHSEKTKRMIGIKNGDPVLMCDITTHAVLQRFETAMDATHYLIAEGRTTNKTANGRIIEICKGNGKSAYGYFWKYAEGVTTNPDECKDVEGKMSYPSKRATLL